MAQRGRIYNKYVSYFAFATNHNCGNRSFAYYYTKTHRSVLLFSSVVRESKRTIAEVNAPVLPIMCIKLNCPDVETIHACG